MGGKMYEDMLALPHPTSTLRVPMARQQRAAQFAPFAALTGYEEAVAECARPTERRIEIDESVREELDRHWRIIREYAGTDTTVAVTYFREDSKKDGGATLTVLGTIRKIDTVQRCFYMDNGTAITFADVLSLDSEVLYRGEDGSFEKSVRRRDNV